MKKLKSIFVFIILFAFSLSSCMMMKKKDTMPAKSLYERLGGKEAITAVVQDFLGRVINDSRINKFFENADPSRLERMLVDQICEATGGPCKYTGQDMKTVHKGMGISTQDFNALVEDLVATLDKFKVPQKEKEELINALAGMKNDIVEKP
jgi:hemoglobin